ncbi:SpoIIE family protein phosphatase [Fervidobacterium islandicum]|uniref:SpoIIE family protein phosphatase n=1 Tax=Fervidobacterium islandicum TaxID=2423 RepID=A0AAI8CK40_FERIS|nr:SpoIIE family protein phosphatase [Fervidobacterium islandicum]AMW32399.1 SpoIIE family protein phosphatase [Fervidobacterium islandicum]
MVSSELIEYLRNAKVIDFIDEIEIPAYVVDTERRIVYWNKQATKLTGYEASEVIGKPCAQQVLNHVDRSGIPVCSTELCPLYQSIKNGIPVQVPFAVYGLTKSGKRRPFSVEGLPIKVENKVIGAIELFTDAEKIDADMAVAIKVQESFVPKSTDNIDFFYRPSSGLGGDMIYYNPPWIGIIDISGHGIAAALVSMLIRTILDQIIAFDPQLNGLPFLLENELKKFDLQNIYLTGIIGQLNEEIFHFINMGHPSPVNVTKKIVLDTKNVVPVGLGLSEEYDSTVINTHDLSSGNLLLFTDGLTEMKTKTGMLGTEGLLNLLSSDDNPSKIYLKTMSQRASGLQEDDITMILIKR